MRNLVSGLLLWSLLGLPLCAQLYLGMPEQDIYFEMGGYPTSTLERGDTRLLIYPDGVRLTVVNATLTDVDGAEFYTEKPEPETDTDEQPEAEPPTETTPEVPDLDQQSVLEQSSPNIPPFPNDDLNRPLEPELALTPEDEQYLAEQTAPLETADPVPPAETRDSSSGVMDPSIPPAGDSEPSILTGVLIEFLLGILLYVIILKVATSVAGVVAYWPGLLAIAFTDSLIRAGLRALFLSQGWPFGGQIQILVSFFVLLYLVKAFTSAREWPTIIKVVVTTKVVGVVMWWLLVLILLN